ncbi:response regulator [Thermomicrobium sp. 4228-Ro]|uniref:response regulator n=1 Tax=Thermomicrobium sp. 4228-Ro TaxID=2993937 RepID=UPI00224970F4|nr:response regulator [Thermomicrobium sp. 4228-Ro]MCX2728212.1 response regulator [Thermomicrobium sp. 4228-Ro]
MLKVLIADDSKMMRVMHVRSLRQVGYEVEATEANNGEEALAVFEPGKFDLVIVDWNMPGMDGVEFVRAAREKEQGTGTHTPILMITSQSTEEQMLKAKDAGVDNLLTKPVTPEALGAALEMLLARA